MQNYQCRGKSYQQSRRLVLCVVIGQLHTDKCDYHAKIN